MSKTETIEELTVATKTALYQLKRAAEDEAIAESRYVGIAIQRLEDALRRTE